MHNAILEKILDPTTAMENCRIDTTTFAYQFISSENFTSEWHRLIDECINDDDDVEQFKNVGYSPTAMQVIELFSDIYASVVDSDEDIDKVVNAYFEKLEVTSELSQGEKECIYSGMAVAAYTPRLWKDKIEMQ